MTIPTKMRRPPRRSLSTREILRDGQGDSSHVNSSLEPLASSGGSLTSENLRLRRRVAELELCLAHIADEERRRIAQELHDGLGQRLVGLGMLATRLRHELAVSGSREVARVSELLRQIDTSRDEVRALTRGLLPVRVEAGTLAQALDDLARRYRVLPNLECRFVCQAPIATLDDAVATDLFRIAQEAVRNAVEHGHPNGVTITLERGPGVVLTVRDDGVGMSSSAPGDGMRIMRFRARRIGGSIRVTSEKDHGTVVTCTVSRRSSPRAASRTV